MYSSWDKFRIIEGSQCRLEVLRWLQVLIEVSDFKLSYCPHFGNGWYSWILKLLRKQSSKNSLTLGLEFQIIKINNFLHQNKSALILTKPDYSNKINRYTRWAIKINPKMFKYFRLEKYFPEFIILKICVYKLSEHEAYCEIARKFKFHLEEWHANRNEKKRRSWALNTTNFKAFIIFFNFMCCIIRVEFGMEIFKFCVTCVCHNLIFGKSGFSE